MTAECENILRSEIWKLNTNFENGKQYFVDVLKISLLFYQKYLK